MLKSLLNFKHIYNSKNEKMIAIIFIILVIIVLQFPKTFRNLINTVIGKLVLLLLIISLASYNVIGGLIATIIMLAYYGYFKNPVKEGLDNMVTVKPTTAATATKKTVEKAVVEKAPANPLMVQLNDRTGKNVASNALPYTSKNLTSSSSSPSASVSTKTEAFSLYK
jgi:predicted membrane protein